jgi:hypothetical protein
MSDEVSPHQLAIETFVAADSAYKQYETLFASGNIMVALMQNRNDELTPEKAVLEFQMAWEKMKELLEDRNVKLKAAKDALRQAVVLSETQWRGPDGKTTVLEQGEFRVSSVTKRSFDPDALFDLLKKNGKYEELMARTKMNKDGQRIPLVEQDWTIQYEDVLNYLKANGLINIEAGQFGPYDETEGTPQVFGPKELAFLGEKKDK